jgi:hypothetical protein
MLAESLLLAMQHGLGLPPSLLGGNAEAQNSNYSCVPQGAYPGVIVANLSSAKRVVCMVINVGGESIALNVAFGGAPPEWRIPADILPPGGWQRLEA